MSKAAENITSPCGLSAYIIKMCKDARGAGNIFFAIDRLVKSGGKYHQPHGLSLCEIQDLWCGNEFGDKGMTVILQVFVKAGQGGENGAVV